MDNRIANDMISSGMIPSGKKKKEDLSRTQYGSAPSPNVLLDAYKSMYDKKEEVINEHHKKDADGNTIPHEHEEELNEGKIPAGLQAYLDKKKGKKEDKKEMKEGIGMAAKAALGLVKNIAKKETVKKLAGDAARGAAMQAGGSMVGGMMSGGGQQKQKTGTVSASADLFDIVKGQLLDEGLSEEEIRDIMLTLTPDEILKEMEDKPYELNVADAKANTPAYQNYMKGMKRKTDGKPMYTASQDMKDRARGLKKDTDVKKDTM